MKKLIPFLMLFPLFVFGEEAGAKIEFKEVSVAPEYLTEKADSDAINVGVVEIVKVDDEEPALGDEYEDEDEDDFFSKAYLAGPAEILATAAVPLAFTGIGAGCGFLPAMENNLGLAITPLTVTLGTGVGAVCGALFAPYLALKGVFDTFTLGAFVDEDYDLTDSTDIVEDKVDVVNEIVLLNNPFEEDEEDDDTTVEEDEEEEEEEEEPEPETEEE